MSTIKQSKFHFSLEINPLLILHQMKINNKETVDILKDKKISERLLDKRRDFVKSLNKLVHKLKFRSQTYYIACFYFDYILKSNNEISIENAAIGSLLLAAKYDELDSIIPEMSKFQAYGNKIYYSIEELKINELTCLVILNYKLNHFTAYHFVNFFFSIGIVFEDDELRNESETKAKVVVNRAIAERLYDLIKEVLLYFVEGNSPNDNR